MSEQKTIDRKKADENTESKIENTDSWITVSDNAVFINIPVEVAEKIPVSEYTPEGGETVKRLVLVGSRKTLEKLVNGEKKGVPLGYFKE